MKIKRYITTFVAIAFAPLVHANFVELGTLELTGSFTLNHNFNFNSPTMPFGQFGSLSVQSATGLFTSYVATGDVLTMNTPFMYVSHGSTPVVLPDGSVTFGTLPQPMRWSVGGFTVTTLWDNVAGAPQAGESCLGLGDLTGNGFDSSAYQPHGALTVWSFTAPPYDISNFPRDITGPINMNIGVGYDNGHVPEGGSTLSLLILTCCSFVGLSFWFRFVTVPSSCSSSS